MILVSKCLLGENCKYNGGNNFTKNVVEYLKGKEYIAICPECMGEMTVPRDPSEIDQKTGRVFSSKGKDVTTFFQKGAMESLKIAKKHRANLAILKQSSPSCGCGLICDGSFTGTKIKGNGITAQLLLKNGVSIITEKDI